MGARRPSWLKTVAMIVVTIPFLYPFVFLLSVAVRPQGSFIRSEIAFPTSVTSAHLRAAWSDGDLGRAMVNSVIVATVATTLALAISATAAFWFSRRTSRVAQILLGVIVTAWIIPYVIYLIPLYILFARLGLVDNLYALATFYAATNLPFAVYLLSSYIKVSIPQSICEASRVDGAGAWLEFARVILPLAKPALATVGALTFIGTWGDLLTAVVMLPDQAKWTLPVAAASLVGRQSAQIQESAAAAVIATLPLLVVFLASQRALVRGLTAGSGR